jgi:hypothetical protein
MGLINQLVSKRIAARRPPRNLMRSKLGTPGGIGWRINPKKAAYNGVYASAPGSACYIATIYGDNNAWQVKRLRKYRDNVLATHMLGQIFIFLYYKFSPYFVIFFKDIGPLNNAIRKLLNAIVHKISTQGQHDNVL